MLLGGATREAPAQAELRPTYAGSSRANLPPRSSRLGSNKLGGRSNKFCRESVVGLDGADSWQASDDIAVRADGLVGHDVKNHNAMQLASVRPAGAQRLAVRLSLLLGRGSGLHVFPTLLFIGIERLHRNVPTRWPCLFATRDLGKVLVRQLLPCCLLLRRGLTNDQDVLTETIRTGQSGTTADKQRDTRHPNERRKFKIHDRTGSSKEPRRKKQCRRNVGTELPDHHRRATENNDPAVRCRITHARGHQITN